MQTEADETGNSSSSSTANEYRFDCHVCGQENHGAKLFRILNVASADGKTLKKVQVPIPERFMAERWEALSKIHAYDRSKLLVKN